MDNSIYKFRENDIRPYGLMEKVKACVAWDRNFLLQRQDNFVEIDCPACNSKRHIFYLEKLSIKYRLCQDCKTLFVNPRPSSELLREFYVQSKNYEFWNKYIFPATENVRREKIFKPLTALTVSFADRFLAKYDSIMEIGAGFGIFCDEVIKTGHFKKVLALEPSPCLAETCRRRNLETLEMPIEDFSEAAAVDIVAGFEVIEHLFLPQEFFRHCFSILSPGGLLVLTCPNVKGFDISVLQTLSDSIDHEHLNYFHPASLSHLAAQCGFEVLEIRTPGKLDCELVRKKILTGEFNVPPESFLRYILINKWEQVGDRFQQFLADNLLSSHMWLVARKGTKRLRPVSSKR